MCLLDGGGKLIKDALDSLADLADLPGGEAGLVAAGGEQVEVVAGVPGDASGKMFHLAQDGLALFARAFGPVLRGHFHAEGVDLAEEGERLLRHAVEQSGTADEHGGLHQGARGVAQEHPVDGEVDRGFQAGAVEVNVVEAHGGFQAGIKSPGLDAGAGEQGDELVVDGAESRLIDPMGETVAGAFGEGLDAVHAADLEEPLEQRAVG